jgi:hypothetical protein
MIALNSIQSNNSGNDGNYHATITDTNLDGWMANREMHASLLACVVIDEEKFANRKENGRNGKCQTRTIQ